MCAIRTLDEKTNIFIRDSHLLAREMLHKDFDRNGSAEKEKNLWS
jgi:hypothetical protein